MLVSNSLERYADLVGARWFTLRLDVHHLEVGLGTKGGCRVLCLNNNLAAIRYRDSIIVSRLRIQRVGARRIQCGDLLLVGRCNLVVEGVLCRGW